MYILKHLFYIPFLFSSLLTNAAEESLDLTKNNGVSWRINPKIPKSIINKLITMVNTGLFILKVDKLILNLEV